ncbi:rhomboid family intramembrane serine protease [Marivivens marinus]|uniref:rhomboid family intramembrane serine protease n=1 Tax=Marivivens marinus TaxID=3110173 RepID=UPI003B846211
MFPIRDHNPSDKVAYVTYALIILNISVFILTVTVFQTDRDLAKLYWHYALIPDRLSSGDNPLALITSQFLHGGFLHLAGNMLFLWIFGDNMEEEMGHLGFLLFYLTAGVGAGLAQYASAPASNVPMIGASGAIAGVMGAYLLFFPKAQVDVLIIIIFFFRIIPIPAWIVLGVWFGLQLFSGVGDSGQAGGVAYWAHAGGFLVGIALALPLWLRKGATAFWSRTDGHPPHPEARYARIDSRIPTVRRRK